MRPFGFSGKTAADFQRHHLMPVNVIRRRAFSPLFSSISSVGFDATDFRSNGLLLPATERMAEQTGLPLHRGPHCRYDQLVAECLNIVSNEGADRGNIVAYRNISQLQGMLRRALERDASLTLNRNDPRALTCPLLKLDHDILQLGISALLA